MVSFVFGWGLPSPIIEFHQNKKWTWPWARGALQNFGISFNISATAEASEFKFGKPLRFTKAHHKIPMQKKSCLLYTSPSPRD